MRFTKAQHGRMFLKIDLEKSYNMMEWEFIEETLKDIALPLNIINVIMSLLRNFLSNTLQWRSNREN